MMRSLGWRVLWAVAGGLLSLLAFSPVATAHAVDGEPAVEAPIPVRQPVLIAPAPASTAPRYRSGQVLVGFRPGVAPAERRILEGLVDGRVVRPLVQVTGASRAARALERRIGPSYVLEVPRGTVVRAVRRLRQQRRWIRYAEPDYEMRASGMSTQPTVPNDPSFSQQWGDLNTGQTLSPPGVGSTTGTPGADDKATLAWSVSTGSSKIVVGEPDTGVDYTHPDLAANIWSNPGGVGGCASGTHGYDVVHGTCDPMDGDTAPTGGYNGHGTHVAGIIGAVGNNGAGVTGMNWTTTILPVRWLQSENSGSDTSVLISALQWLLQAKQAGVNIRVVNDSSVYVGTAYSQALIDEINTLGANGILFVTAAGNTGQDNDNPQYVRYPCGYDLATEICVTASNQNDALPSWANYGVNTVDLAAPGDNIYSTLEVSRGTYGWISGGSMAAAQVSGAAALILSVDEGLTPQQLKADILDNVDQLPSLAGWVRTGGRLDVCAAMPGCTLTDRTAVSCAPQSLVVGQSTTCTATVSDSAAETTVTPTGTVTFSSDSGGSFSSSASCSLSPAGTAGSESCSVSYTPSAVGAGTHKLTANYAGDPHHGASAGSATVSVTPASTSTSLSCSPGSVLVGQAASCTAKVTNSTVAPTGAVSFSSDSPGSFSSATCSLSSGTAGSASCTVSYTPSSVGSGNHKLTARYGGDSGHAGSSGSAGVAVGQRASSTSLSCSPGSVAVGRSTTCAATVSDTSPGTSAAPTGTVAFTSDSQSSFSPTCTPSSTGTPGSAACSVTYTPSSLGSGTHTLTAKYGGDTNHASSSGTAKVTVAPRATGTSVACSPSTVVVGQASSCTATVSDTSNGTAQTPTGSVSFTSDSQSSFSPTCTLSSTGTVGAAACSVTYTPSAVKSGTHTLTATYGGDTAHAQSSNSASVTVGAAAARATVSCSPGAVTVGEATSCTATVSNTSNGTVPTPTGRVSFSSDSAGSFSSTGCSLSSGTAGSAACGVDYTPSSVGSGTHRLTADYQGDGDHAPSSGTGLLSVAAPPASPGGGSGAGAGGRGLPPVAINPPSISGSALPGNRLTCSAGRWLNSPTRFGYRWSRHGVRIAGAFRRQLTVRIPDEAARLECTVTAVNAAGSTSADAAGGGVLVGFSRAFGCPKPTGRVYQARLGRLRLGMTQTAARRTLPRLKMRGRLQDDFCLYGGWGIQARYTRIRWIVGPPGKRRARIERQIALAMTDNRYYSVRGLRPGASVGAARRWLRNPLRLGTAQWYVIPGQAANMVLEVRRGVVQEIGIASRALTATRWGQKQLLRPLSRAIGADSVRRQPGPVVIARSRPARRTPRVRHGHVG